MDYFSKIYVLLVIAVCYSHQIAAQQNNRRFQSDTFNRNSRASTSEGLTNKRKSMLISDPLNAFNFQKNSRREFEQRNFRDRQIGRNFRNRPEDPRPPSKKKKISPSFSMPILPKLEVRITTPPTTTFRPRYRVESAVVSKPAVSSWLARRPNGVLSAQRQGNRNDQRLNSNNGKTAPVPRTDEHIYMINGHPVRQPGDTLGNRWVQNQRQSASLNDNGGRQNFQPSSNSVNKKQPSTNSFPQNTNDLNKNSGQSQNFNKKKNTVQPAFQRFSNDVHNSQTTRMNNRISGSNNIGAHTRHNLIGLQGNPLRVGAGGLSLTNGQWGKGPVKSPDTLGDLMTLTPNENNIGMNRKHTTNQGYTDPLPSTMPVRIQQNGNVFPSVMPQLSPTRGSEPQLQNSMYKTQVTSGIRIASFPQRRQYVDNRLGVNRVPLPSPRPAIPTESLRIKTRGLQQSNPQPTSTKAVQPTPAFDRSLIPPQYIGGNQLTKSPSIKGSAQRMQMDTGIGISLQNRPMPLRGHSMRMAVSLVDRTEPRSTSGQNIGTRPAQGQIIGPRPTKRPHVRPTPWQHTGPRSSQGQQMEQRLPPGQHMRQMTTTRKHRHTMQSPRHTMGMRQQLLALGPIRSTLSPRGLQVTPILPYMPLKGTKNRSSMPAKPLNNRQVRPSKPPTGPLIGAMPSQTPLKGKMNWHTKSPLTPIGQQAAKTMQPWLPQRRHTLSPMRPSHPPRGRNIGINMRPTARSSGMIITPSQRPLFHNWPDTSVVSLPGPSVQPITGNSDVVGAANGQVMSASSSHVNTEPMTLIQTNISDAVSDVSSNYVSMTWVRSEQRGISPDLDQTGIRQMPISKTPSDDDNGHHKVETYNGEYSGKDMAKTNKHDVTLPISRDAVNASTFRPEPRHNVKDSEVHFTTKRRFNRVNSPQTTATPSKEAASLTKGTVSDFDMFLIQTTNSFGREPKPVETKTKSTTEKKGRVTEDNTNAIEPVITSKISRQQQMRIFDINAFSIIRSQYLPKVPVLPRTTEIPPTTSPSTTAATTTTTATTTPTTTTTTSTSTTVLPSSIATPPPSSPMPASSQSSVDSTTIDTLTSTAYNIVVETTLTDTTQATQEAITTTTTTTSKQPVILRNKNVIPPGLQEMMDALKRPDFEKSIPINLYQIYGSGISAADSLNSVNMNEQAGGIKISSNLDRFFHGTTRSWFQGNSEIIEKTTTPRPPPSTTFNIIPSVTTLMPTTNVIQSTLPVKETLYSTVASGTNPQNPDKSQDLYDTSSVPSMTTDSVSVPFFVDNGFRQELNMNSLMSSLEPTSDTPKSTSSDKSKTNVFFGMWSPTPHNRTSAGETQKVSPTSSLTAGSHTPNNGITYSIVTTTSPNTPVVSVDNLVEYVAATPTLASTPSRSPIQVQGTRSDPDATYQIVPVPKIISDNLKKNITDLRRQHGDIFVPSAVIPSTVLSKTDKVSTSYTFDKKQNEVDVTLRRKTGHGGRKPVRSGIAAGVAVHTPSIYPKKPVPRPALANDNDLLNMFGVRNSPFQGIIIDSYFTMTVPKVSSTPSPRPFDKKEIYGESNNIKTNAKVQQQAQESPSNFNVQKQTQESQSNFNVQKQTQESDFSVPKQTKKSQSNVNVHKHGQEYQSNFNVQQQDKIGQSNVPKSGNSMTNSFEVPNFFSHMTNPFSNEDAGVKHRFLKPKTSQGADKPFETAVHVPVVTTAAPNSRKPASVPKDTKPSDQGSQTTVASDSIHDPANGKTNSNLHSDAKYRTSDVSTSDNKSNSYKKDVSKTETKLKKSNTIPFNTAPQGIAIDASFMANLPFFLGPVDVNSFKGMQVKESQDVKPPRSWVPPKTKTLRTTPAPIVTTTPVRAVSTAKPSRAKMEYDLKVLCMQMKSSMNDHMYIPHPGDCSKIIQCTPNGKDILAETRHCPLGLFWDHDTQQCGDPGDVTCFDDPCQKGYFNYSSHGGCGTYYKCFAGVSVPACCPVGLRFVQTTADSGDCVWDTTCSEKCDTLQSSSLRKRGGCPALEVESRKDAYWMLQRGSLSLKTCPDGLIYSHPDCKCKSTIRPRPTSKSMPKCKPEFKLTFDGGFIKDVSDGGLAFSQVNVVGTNNNTAVFSENGYISLWGFQNRYLGRTFSIRMRVRADKGSCKTGGRSIVSNCGPDGPTSVEIACDKNKISFKANTDNTKVPTVVRTAIKDNEWTDIIYTYKSNRFNGSVNDRRFSKLLTGNLESRNNPLIIGKCPKSPGFVGEIDQLEIYTHCVP